ncbi:MAG: M23 family metallopeptidase [Nannocystaceae bacterium]
MAFAVAGAATTAIAAPRRARELGVQLVDTLQRELGLTRSSAEIHRGLEALDREQSSLQYTAALLDHASSESMRRLSAYAEGTDARELRLRSRARSLYKLARGGAARLAFGERFGDEAEGATAQRLAQARSLRELVRHDLHELSSHRRARARARAELLSASRELAALATVGSIYTMQGEVLHHAGAAIDPQVEGAVRSRKLALRRSPKSARQANRELVKLVKANWSELEQLRGLDGARSLRRPVIGNVVGRFGTYLDRVLAVPVVRNGVELTAAREETVFAMATGRVVMVTELPEYGEAVVIEHGGGQYSLTARLWKIAVAPGDAVEPGTVLGRAAPKAIDDGLGPTIYVELRHGERPVDPEPYLRRAVATRKPKARRGRAAAEPSAAADDDAIDDDDVELLLE